MDVGDINVEELKNATVSKIADKVPTAEVGDIVSTNRDDHKHKLLEKTYFASHVGEDGVERFGFVNEADIKEIQNE